MNKKKISWKINRAGSFKRLKLVEEELSILEEGKLRIEIKSIGLNFADLFAITGLYSATPKGEFIPGLEFSGIIKEKNTESSFKIGDPVIGLCRFAAYSNYVDSTQDYLLPLPKDWSFEQGAAFPVQTLTALYALKYLGNLKKQQNVLIHSAAGGVGLQAMALAKVMGAKPIGTVSSNFKKEFLLERGYKDVLTREKSFLKQLNTYLNGTRLHLVLDAIGGKIQKDSYNALTPTGRLVVFGAAEFSPGKKGPKVFSSIIKYLKRPKYDPLSMVNENKSVLAFNLIWLWEELELLKEMLIDLEKYKLEPPFIGHQYKFKDIHEALQFFRSGASTGKIIINID